MSTMRYLRDPYNQVFKVTATADSEFKLRINNQIFYSFSDIHSLIESVDDGFFPVEMDSFSKKVYWMIANSGVGGKLAAGSGKDLMNRNVFHYFNSYTQDICYLVPQASLQVMNKYYPNQTKPMIYPDHGSTFIENFAVYDSMMRELNYNGKYIHATFEDVKADKKIHNEPIKRAFPFVHENYSHDTTLLAKQEYIAPVSYDLKMSLIDTSNMVFPVKSTNNPKDDSGANIIEYANAIVTVPSGKTGSIEMPFTLLQITGTGLVIVNEITYNLPVDEVALKAVLQSYDNYYHSFDIITNTGGVVAEFLVSHRFYLFNKNYIDLQLTAGNVNIERVATTTPMDTTVVSINKKDADQYTLDFRNYFSKNKSFRIPQARLMQWDDKAVYFKTSTDLKYLPVRVYNYSTDVLSVSAGTKVYDQCFIAKLMPRNDTFTGTLELSFTVFDGSTTYYTLDGSTPDATKTLYTTPFTISATTTVKWINIKTDYANSHVNTRVITKTI